MQVSKDLDRSLRCSNRPVIVGLKKLRAGFCTFYHTVSHLSKLITAQTFYRSFIIALNHIKKTFVRRSGAYARFFGETGVMQTASGLPKKSLEERKVSSEGGGGEVGQRAEGGEKRRSTAFSTAFFFNREPDARFT